MKRLSIADLEKMTTHEVADLLGNIVLLLRRMPDVPMVDLQPIEKPPIDADGIAAGVRHEPKTTKAHTGNLPTWVDEE